jgi:hypothetical protein
MNNDDSAIIMRKAIRRLHAVYNQCAVRSVRQHVQRAIRSIEAGQRALAKFREAHDTPPLTPASVDDFVNLKEIQK